MGTLYLVSTPIGNLGDVTRRAADTLESVARILAEDTRRTRILLQHLQISTPLVSLHAHNEASRERLVLAWLGSGEDLALVSDAGTPLVSDPGSRLVQAVAAAGHDVVPLPGPSAVLAALVGSGLPTDRFLFAGFPARKGPERKELLSRLASAAETTVLFESPERLTSLLGELSDWCGPERPAVAARELTKVHEEFVRGTVGELAEHFETHPPRGEITLVVAGAAPVETSQGMDEAAVRALAGPLLDGGTPPSRVAREVAARLRVPRNRVYRIVQELSSDSRRTD
jgi:16S rRNA (cytidine1402-2'-O)-methyltransferase